MSLKYTSPPRNLRTFLWACKIGSGAGGTFVPGTRCKTSYTSYTCMYIYHINVCIYTMYMYVSVHHTSIIQVYIRPPYTYPPGTNPTSKAMGTCSGFSSPQRALPTETNVESGTSQSKSGTSVSLNDSGLPCSRAGAARR